MISNLLKNGKAVFIIIIILSFACTDSKKETNIETNKFYKDLSGNINGEKLSPLEFSAGGKHGQSRNISFTEGTENVECVADSDTYKILYSPISVIKTGNGKRKDADYTVRLHFKNGTIKTINRLLKPQKSENKIVFRTETDGVELEFEAFSGYIKWGIKCDKTDQIDSLLILITTKGPYFGGGERFISSVLDGRTITNQPTDHYRIVDDKSIDAEAIRKYEPSYLQVPFVITPDGPGWYFDGASTIRMTFDTESKFFEVKIPGSQTDFYVFDNATPKDILNSYTSFLGRQPALPDWAFGVWINLLEGKDSVYSKVNKLREWKIPATAVWLFDLDDPRTSTGFLDWSKGYYGNSRQLTDSLHNMGLKVLTYLHPFSLKNLQYYKFENPVYKHLDSLKLIFRPTRTLDPSRFKTFIEDGQYDFYNPEMYNVWYSFLHELLITDNFDGWMEDFGDLGYIYDNKEREWETIPFTINHKLPAEDYFNMYPLVYHKLTYQLVSELKKDVVGFCRSGSAGSAAYTRLLWGGDQVANWDKKFGYPSAVTAAISSGLSGYGNWAPDILCDSPSKELWMRWVQFGAFTTLMRDHLWDNDKSSIDLWTDESTHKYFKKYADIHTQLIPYLRAAADYYQQTGCPVIRHMFLEFPEDKETQKCEYQYMLGEKFLVAPVVEEGAKSTRIYFPKGRWKDFWTKKIFDSQGVWQSLPVTMEQIPVFERL
jgi:alpha-glucosidase (family GH31 glycosyl hydrolase)